MTGLVFACFSANMFSGLGHVTGCLTGCQRNAERFRGGWQVTQLNMLLVLQLATSTETWSLCAWLMGIRKVLWSRRVHLSVYRT